MALRTLICIELQTYLHLKEVRNLKFYVITRVTIIDCCHISYNKYTKNLSPGETSACIFSFFFFFLARIDLSVNNVAYKHHWLYDDNITAENITEAWRRE